MTLIPAREDVGHRGLDDDGFQPVARQLRQFLSEPLFLVDDGLDIVVQFFALDGRDGLESLDGIVTGVELPLRDWNGKRIGMLLSCVDDDDHENRPDDYL